MPLVKRQHKHNLENLNKERIKQSFKESKIMTKPTIKITAKNVYGKILYYPDCTVSQAACELSGKKTLDIRDIKLLMTMGFDYEVNATPIVGAIFKTNLEN